MRKVGLHEQATSLERSQRDAKALSSAHDAVNGKFLKSYVQLFLRYPKETWPGLAVIMAAGHGVGLPFPLPQVLGAGFMGSWLKLRAKGEAGRVGTRLQAELPEQSFRTRTKAEAPETFSYRDPDEGWNGGSQQASPNNPEQAKAAAVKAAMANRKGSR
jgi:hypothetical protein